MPTPSRRIGRPGSPARPACSTAPSCCAAITRRGRGRPPRPVRDALRHLHLLPGTRGTPTPASQTPRIANAFAAIVPWTSDGAVLLGEMGAARPSRPALLPLRHSGSGRHTGRAGRSRRQRRPGTRRGDRLALPDEAETDWCCWRGRAARVPGPGALPGDGRAARGADRRPSRRRGRAGTRRDARVRGRDDIDSARMPGFVRAYLADATRPPADRRGAGKDVFVSPRGRPDVISGINRGAIQIFVSLTRPRGKHKLAFHRTAPHNAAADRGRPHAHRISRASRRPPVRRALLAAALTLATRRCHD